MKFSDKVRAVRKAMNAVVFEREDPIHILPIIMLSKDGVYLEGPAGCAKSMNAAMFARCFKIIRYLDIQMDPFIKKDEVEGQVDPFEYKNGIFKRIRDNLATRVDFMNVDEISRTETILHSFYRWFNERMYTEMGKNYSIPLRAFHATGNFPLQNVHQALFDRFAFYFYTEAMSDDNCELLLEPEGKISLSDDEKFIVEDFEEEEKKLPNVKIPGDIVKTWKEILVELKNPIPDTTGKNQIPAVVVSDRMKRWSGRIMRASALCEGRMEVTEDDLWVMRNCFARTRKEIPVVHRVMRKHVNQEIDSIITLYDQYQDTWKTWKETKTDSRVYEGQCKDIKNSFDRIVPKEINKTEYMRMKRNIMGWHAELAAAAQNAMRNGTR